MKTKFLNTCPVTGGLCANPLCIFGCIENIITKTKISKYKVSIKKQFLDKKV